jgi:transposase
MRAWRKPTRTRISLVQTRTQAKNRLGKLLEDTNIKVAHGVSELFGTRGRRMLAALIAGERTPKKLATLALGTWCRTLSTLELALTGPCTAHH